MSEPQEARAGSRAGHALFAGGTAALALGAGIQFGVGWGLMVAGAIAMTLGFASVRGPTK